jgi:glucose/mannose-6-phosphate isomerase
VSDPLDRIREVDEQNQLDDVLAMPEHLRDALWRVESAGLQEAESGGLVVCGMGGSGIGGALTRAALGDSVLRPLHVFRDYEIPPWTPQDRTVFCVSYSGNTEETLACFEAAEAIGGRRIVATTGGALAEAARRAGVPVIGIPSGLQPRAAVGYMVAITCEVAGYSGIAPYVRTEIDGAAAYLEASRDALVDRAAEIADQLAGSVPLIYGCDLTAPVAYRWKTQINENAKVHAFSHVLPELDHNELVGWTADGQPQRFAAVFLEDSDQHPRERERAALTAKLIADSATAVINVETQGETRISRLLWTVMLGDLVSLHLAAIRGIDPSPVAVIEKLKDELGRP